MEIKRKTKNKVWQQLVELRFLWHMMLIIATLPVMGCKDIEDKLNTYLIAAEAHWGFSGSVLVAVDGHVILSEGYGQANVTVGEPNRPDTKFFIGSITKQFTAAAILKLVEQGKLNLDSTVGNYLSDFPPAIGSKVTVRHLLTHQSGIPCYSNNPLLLLHRMEGISPTRLTALIKTSPLEFEPGSAFKYSNSGYILLGQIIEAISGQSYEAFLHHEILKPIGMSNSGYARREAGHPQRADGYTLTESGQLIQAYPIDYSILHSAGALYSTVLDMLKWDEALRIGSLLSPNSLQKMYSPDLSNYGFGWVIEERWGQTVVHHGGFLDGFNSAFERYPISGLCVAVFSNEDYAPVKRIAYDLAAILGGKEYSKPVEQTPVEIEASVLTEYLGIYGVGPERYRYVISVQDSLYTYTSGGARQRLLSLGNDNFYFATSPSTTISFIRELNGTVVSYFIDEVINREPGVRLSSDDAARLQFGPGRIHLQPDVCESWAGRYSVNSQDEVLDSLLPITIICIDDQSLQLIAGEYTLLLKPISSTEFVHPLGDFGVSFEIDAKNQNKSCTIRLGSNSVKAEYVPFSEVPKTVR